MLWGITPSINLLEEIKLTEDLNEVNVLILGGNDGRHILQTLSENQHQNHIKINFYIMELVPESIAKQLLLFNIAFTPIKEFGIAQKTRTFMELFGNTLLRPVTAKFLTNKAEDLIKMITDEKYLKEAMPFINLDIKYKERDYLENLFKFWLGKDDFDILQAWDKRLRKTLGIRYDTRNGAFDWDLHMRLHLIGGKLINSQEYQSFRRNGVAFAWLQSEVTKPNRSMVTGVLRDGDDFGHYGYLGDMQTGPFIAYGLTCNDEQYLKKSNNIYKYRATDLTERNLREIFHNIEFKTHYDHQNTSDLSLGTCIMQLSNAKVVDVGNFAVTKHKFTQCFPLENVTINFITFSKYEMMKHKDCYKNKFDLIYFANNYTKYLMADVLNHISKEKSFLIVEHRLFVLDNRDKELESYYKEIEDKLDGLEKCVCPFDYKKDAYIKYIIN